LNEFLELFIKSSTFCQGFLIPYKFYKKQIETLKAISMPQNKNYQVKE